jgi:GNAT superfamily N-acetyltransferase
MPDPSLSDGSRIGKQLDDVTVRRAGAEDARTVADQFRAMYGNSDHPFSTVEGVSCFLADPRNFQLVAEKHGQIVSSAAMTYYSWNDSYELGRVLTHPEYRRQGLAGVLMQLVADWACGQARGEVFFSFPRSRRTFELCTTLNPRMIVTGHNGGRSVANGSREIHPVLYSLPRHIKFSHVTPQGLEVQDSLFVLHRIYEPLGLCPSPGEYPAGYFVGEVSSNAIAFEDFIIEREPDSPSRALDIVGDSQRCSRPQKRFSRSLSGLLRILPEVEHITATILADKIETIGELCEFGFQFVAYLPAWYKVNESRFDCVQLVRRTYVEPAPAPGLEDLLATLEPAIASSLVFQTRTYA